MFPFLFLSQLNSPHSSSYLRFLKRICQKGTAAETCTRTRSLTTRRPGHSNTHQVQRCWISGVEFLTEIGLQDGLRVSWVPTKAYLIHENPFVPLVWAGAQMGDGEGEKARNSPPCLPQGGRARQRHKGVPPRPPTLLSWAFLLDRKAQTRPPDLGHSPQSPQRPLYIIKTRERGGREAQETRDTTTPPNITHTHTHTHMYKLPYSSDGKEICLQSRRPRFDPREKEVTTSSSILAWRIPWTEEPGGLQSTGLHRVGHNRAINTSTLLYTPTLMADWCLHAAETNTTL